MARHNRLHVVLGCWVFIHIAIFVMQHSLQAEADPSDNVFRGLE